jgi:biotin carboxylase
MLLPGPRGACRICPDDDKLIHGYNLLVFNPGMMGRRRLLHSLLDSGCHLIIYHSQRQDWVQTYFKNDANASNLSFIVGNLNDFDEALAKIQSSSCKLDGILCYDDYSVELAAKLCDALKLPGIPPDLAARIRDKFEFRKACQQAGIRFPKFLRIYCSDGEDWIDGVIEQKLEFPVVMKPIHGAGSANVMKIHRLEDLIQEVSKNSPSVKEMQASMGLSEDKAGFVIEEFIQGAEYDVDCVVQNGKVLFAGVNTNLPTKEPFFVELGGSFPVLESDVHSQLSNLAQEVINAFGSSLSGVFHFEAIVCKEAEAVPLELNLRIGGAETYSANLSTWGVDLAQLAAAISLGRSLSEIRFPSVNSCFIESVNFHSPDLVGAQKLICSEVQDDHDLVDIEFYYQPGSIVKFPPLGFSALGWMTVKGKTKQEAQENAKRVQKGVCFTFEKVETSSLHVG